MQSKSPERMCMACRQRQPKRELVRIVRTEDGAVYDKSGRMDGRGCYICKKQECLDRAVKSNAIYRALGVKLSDEELEKIKAVILKGDE